MVALDATHWQFAEVHELKLIACFDTLISCSIRDIFRVPLLPKLFIRRYIVHDLVVHLESETAKHQEEGKTIDKADPVEDLHPINETTWLISFVFVLFSIIGKEVILAHRNVVEVKKAQDESQ